MYGYLRPDNSALEFEVRRYYRERYCSLCHSLWNNYGVVSRMLLSYDVTFTAVVIELTSQVDFNKDKMLCYKRKRIISDTEQWRKLAAISVLLAGGKLKDNIDDERSILAKTLLFVYARTIKKAEKDYPDLASFLYSSLENMSKLEKSNGSLVQLADAFARMMRGAFEMLFESNDYKVAVAEHVSKWVYFIDAIDDLDADVKRHRYNPLASVATSRKDLIENHLDIVSSFIAAQSEAIKPYTEMIKSDEIASRMTRSIFSDTIPEVTKKVLLGQSVKNYTSPHLRLIQAREGIVFA